jgi:hypothetical protein
VELVVEKEELPGAAGGMVTSTMEDVTEGVPVPVQEPAVAPTAETTARVSAVMASAGTKARPAIKVETKDVAVTEAMAVII